MSKITKPKQRRNRAITVCTNCKRKKIKCDKKKPCTNCIQSFIADSCTYVYDTKSFPKASKVVSKPTIDDFCIITKKECSNEHNHDEGAFLNKKFELAEKFIIFRKPSNTQSVRFLYSILLKKNIFSSKVSDSFKKLLNKERDLWKSKSKAFKKIHLTELVFNSYSDTYVNTLNAKIEDLFCCNYHAISERYNYFRIKLNKLLFDSCIPVNIVQIIFQHYFTLTPTGVIFNHPQKNYEYSSIALLSAVLAITNIFSKQDKIQFNFPLIQLDNEFNDMAITCLNVSNYKRKRSIFSVYTLIILRLSLMVYGNSHSMGLYSQNSYPLFHSAVGICMDMGLNLNITKLDISTLYSCENNYLQSIQFAKEISIEQYKKLWNYLLFVDCTYFINAGIPPTINNIFCHGYYYEVSGELKSVGNVFTMISNNAGEVLGNKSISLHDLFDSAFQLTDILKQLPPFESFKFVEKRDYLWMPYFMKFKVLKLLYLYLVQINFLLEDDNLRLYFSHDVLETEEATIHIQNLKYEYSLKIRLIYILAFNTMIEISESSPSLMFGFYFKEIFSEWIGVETLAFIELLGNNKDNLQNIENQKSFKLPQVPKFDNKNLENLLCNFNINENHSERAIFEANCKPSILVSFLTYFYEKILGLEVLFSDYNLFVMTKLFSFTLYFVYFFINCYYDPEFNVDNHFEKIKMLTQHVVSKILQKGKLTFLLPTHPLTNLKDNAESNEDEASKLYADSETDALQTIIPDSFTPTSIVPSTEVNLQSQFDDIASSIFNDEDVVSLFKEIDEFFSQDG